MIMELHKPSLSDNPLKREVSALEIYELEHCVEALKAQYKTAFEFGDPEEIKKVLNDSRPFVSRLHVLRALLKFRQTVPAVWTHTASEQELCAAIKDGRLRAAAESDDAHERCMLLMGPTDRGKTVAMSLAIRRYFFHQQKRPKVSVDWYYARDLVAAQIERSYFVGPSPDMERAKSAGLLVLDDVGLERDHGPIIDVLQARIDADLPTWITSGFDWGELVGKYGDATVRRMTQRHGEGGTIVSTFDTR